jgi:hypothetical protein
MSSVQIHNGGILISGGAIAIDPECCCDPPCTGCMAIDAFGYDFDEFLVEIYITAASLSPTIVCDGEFATLTFSITNNTGEAWAADCVEPFLEDCAVTLILFDYAAKIDTVTAPGADITVSGGGLRFDWQQQSFAIGEVKQYEITFRLTACVTPNMTSEVYYNRGYRGFINFICVACP